MVSVYFCLCTDMALYNTALLVGLVFFLAELLTLGFCADFDLGLPTFAVLFGVCCADLDLGLPTVDVVGLSAI